MKDGGGRGEHGAVPGFGAGRDGAVPGPGGAKSHAEHRAQLAKLFNRLRNTNLKVNLKKCEFGADNVSYLGYRLTPEGILPGADKLKSVRDAPVPTTVHQVRHIMGLCNFFRSHIKIFAMIVIAGEHINRFN